MLNIVSFLKWQITSGAIFSEDVFDEESNKVGIMTGRFPVKLGMTLRIALVVDKEK